jgi:hypothetical protein
VLINIVLIDTRSLGSIYGHLNCPAVFLFATFIYVTVPHDANFFFMVKATFEDILKYGNIISKRDLQHAFFNLYSFPLSLKKGR